MNPRLALVSPPPRFLIAWLLVLAPGVFAAATPAAPPSRSLQPPVWLPDSSEFKTWEEVPKFSHTYHANASHPMASDGNPGTQGRPFATINRAAQVLQPGERVVVHAGVYRERIKPARGGTSPSAMVSYEAAPGSQVILKGSRVFEGTWRRSTNLAVAAWEANLEPRFFDRYNPFDVENVTPGQFEVMDWATPLRGKTPYTLPRGLVFQGGRRLSQVAARDELISAEGTYWVDRKAQVLHVRPFGDLDPARAAFEISTQETVFAPDQHGLGFIRVKGFVVEHAAGPWPWEQVGAISTTRGHHWILEDNTVRWANGVGIDLGIQHFRWPQPATVGFHIVRRNVVTDCGICGIAGLGPGTKEFGLQIEDNVLARNAFFDVERLFETGAIKTHNNVRCLIRRNLILDTRHGPGIWMDWNNQFSRCCQNVIVGTSTMHGGIFVEASYEPNLVDHNFIWSTDGHGIYEHDSCNQVFAHNFIGRSSKSGMHLHGKMTDRRISGRPIVGGRHTVANNVFVESAKANEFRGEPSIVRGNLDTGLTATLDASDLILTWSVLGRVEEVMPLKTMPFDFFGHPRRPLAVYPGPFAELPGTRAQRIQLWPLNPQAPRP